MEMIKCTKCKCDMPKLRLTSYGYDFCVSCSEVKPKVGRVIVIGEGDHTATELDVVDSQTAMRLQELENNSRGIRNTPLDILNFEEDELFDSIQIITSTTLNSLEDDLEIGIGIDVSDLELDEEEEEEVSDEDELEEED
jgi:hypothetical protein